MRLSRRYALTGIVAALVPLLLFGGLALHAVRTGTRDSVGRAMAAVSAGAAAQMDQWLSRTGAMLLALAAELQGTGLTEWQQERALRNYLLAFPEFRAITLFDGAGRPLASTHLSREGLSPPEGLAARAGEVVFSPVALDDDALPMVQAVVDIDPGAGDGMRLVASLSLEEMWRVLDRLQGTGNGHALLVEPSGRLLAHGDPSQKARVARGDLLAAHPLVGEELRHAVLEYVGRDGVEYLGAVAPVTGAGWHLVLEQPTREAYAQALYLQRVLIVAIVLTLVTMVVVGARLGRSLLEPIGRLVDATSAVADGNLDARVSPARDDEFRRLGQAFNSMAARLGELQERAVRQERHALFGRVAAGLVHDLSHPVHNLLNSSRLLLRRPDDLDYREVFRRTMEREGGTMRRVLDDLRQLGNPSPLERFRLDVTRQVRDTLESMRAAAETASVSLDFDGDAGIAVNGDAFALGRVWRNVVQNGIEAAGAGGRVHATVRASGGAAIVTIRDSGPGIAPAQLPRLFDEFATTKRRGLGLGLAISRKIVEQLGGTIGASNAPGGGAVFEIRLPLAETPVAVTSS